MMVTIIRGLLIREGAPRSRHPQANYHQKTSRNAAPGKHIRLPNQFSQQLQPLADIGVTDNVALPVTTVQRIHHSAAVSWGDTQTVAHTNRKAIH